MDVRFWIIVVASLDALVALNNVGSITMNSGENHPTASVISGSYAYFGTSNAPGFVIQVDLTTFTRVGSISFNSNENSILLVKLVRSTCTTIPGLVSVPK